MAKKPQYVELILKNEGLLPSHPLAGYTIVSDYVGDQGRHLFLRRGSLDSAPPSHPVTPSPAVKRARKKAKALKAAAPATAEPQAVGV